MNSPDLTSFFNLSQRAIIANCILATYIPHILQLHSTYLPVLPADSYALSRVCCVVFDLLYSRLSAVIKGNNMLETPPTYEKYQQFENHPPVEIQSACCVWRHLFQYTFHSLCQPPWEYVTLKANIQTRGLLLRVNCPA